MFPKKTEVLTEIENQIRLKYKIVHTPAVLMYKNGLFEYIPYEELFDEVYLKEETKTRIKNFYKKKLLFFQRRQ
jgi:hypothetical protein